MGFEKPMMPQQRRRSDAERILWTLVFCGLFVAVGYIAGRRLNPPSTEPPRAAFRQAESTAPKIAVLPSPEIQQEPPARAHRVTKSPKAPASETIRGTPRRSIRIARRIPKAPANTPKRRIRPERKRIASRRSRNTGPVLGTWRGLHTGHRATLVLHRATGHRVNGTMTVRTGGRNLRIAVQGERDPQSGAIRLAETTVLNGPRNAWDVGVNAGLVEGSTMSGRGRDTRGRRYTWSFTREQ